jgi:hypothetical protein
MGGPQFRPLVADTALCTNTLRKRESVQARQQPASKVTQWWLRSFAQPACLTHQQCILLRLPSSRSNARHARSQTREQRARRLTVSLITVYKPPRTPAQQAMRLSSRSSSSPTQTVTDYNISDDHQKPTWAYPKVSALCPRADHIMVLSAKSPIQGDRDPSASEFTVPAPYTSRIGAHKMRRRANMRELLRFHHKLVLRRRDGPPRPSRTSTFGKAHSLAHPVPTT